MRSACFISFFDWSYVYQCIEKLVWMGVGESQEFPSLRFLCCFYRIMERLGLDGSSNMKAFARLCVVYVLTFQCESKTVQMLRGVLWLISIKHKAWAFFETSVCWFCVRRDLKNLSLIVHEHKLHAKYPQRVRNEHLLLCRSKMGHILHLLFLSFLCK